jgi:hypothetical protein
MRACLVVLLVLFALPALADAPPPVVVAPAGECAGEERDLAVNLLPRAGSSGSASPMGEPGASEPARAGSAPTGPPAVLHLTPTQVAAAGGQPAASLPEPPSFAGPGACDNPGSGCAPSKIFDDPNPGSGCGFPGSPCP